MTQLKSSKLPASTCVTAIRKVSIDMNKIDWFVLSMILLVCVISAATVINLSIEYLLNIR